MKIAVIGTGNVGGALAGKWASKGHQIYLGVREVSDFSDNDLLRNSNTKVMKVSEAVHEADVILIAVPAEAAVEVARSLGNTEGKVIIDAMNIVAGRGPEGYSNTTDAILANTATKDVAKCFNITGFNNIENTNYGDTVIDMFVAGDSEKGKTVAIQLSADAGFENCYDAGGNDKFELMERFAGFWINLAMNRGYGRDIAFKLLKR